VRNEPPLNREERLRRAGSVCANFARNLAYYRATRENNQRRYPRKNIWVTIEGNFIDAAVLEWCKLFGDANGRHAWQRVVQTPDQFEADLLRTIGKTAEEFEAIRNQVRLYRDRFVAHLDNDRIMHIPNFEPPWEAVQHYFHQIVFVEMNAQERARGGLTNIRNYYSDCFDELRKNLIAPVDED